MKNLSLLLGGILSVLSLTFVAQAVANYETKGDALEMNTATIQNAIDATEKVGEDVVTFNLDIYLNW